MMTAEEVRASFPNEFDIAIEQADLDNAIRGESDECVVAHAIRRTLKLEHNLIVWVDPDDFTLEMDEDSKCPVTVCTYDMSPDSVYLIEHFDETGEVKVGSKLKATRADESN